MKVATLGAIQIAITPKSADGEILEVAICSETRTDVIRMDTAKDETLDQLMTRLKSMLRALFNNEPRKEVVEAKKPVLEVKPSFSQQKDMIQNKAKL